jgi:hypothetical protein
MQMVRRAQVTLTLGAFLGQDMTAMGLTALDRTGGFEFETLCSAPVGFDFGHYA